MGAPDTVWSGNEAVEKAAATLFEAQTSGRCVEARTLLRLAGKAAGDDLSLALAYDVQDAVTERHLRAGRRRVGWKVGMTNDDRRAAMGLSEPTRGTIFHDACLRMSRGTVDARQAFWQIEPEIVARVETTLPGDATEGDVAASVTILPGMEIVRSRIAGWPSAPFGCAVADNSAADLVIAAPQGRRLEPEEVAGVAVIVYGPSGRAEGRASAVLGQPLRAVSWLASHLERRGKALKRGDLIFTGGVVAAMPGEPGVYRAEFSHGLGDIEIDVQP